MSDFRLMLGSAASTNEICYPGLYLEKVFGGFVVGEEGVTVDVVEVTLVGRGAARGDGRRQGGVEAEQRVEPRLDAVAVAVADRFAQRHLGQRPAQRLDGNAIGRLLGRTWNVSRH